MIRIAVVEDDAAQVELLRRYLDEYASERGETIVVSAFADGMELTEDYTPVYQVLLLDIELPNMDGLTAARKIRETDPDVAIIFITNMAKYAIRGYEVHALDFVLKPVSYFAFAMKLDKAIATIRAREQAVILLSTEEGMRRLEAADIAYFEVVNHRLVIHARSGVYTSGATLNAVEEKLAGQNFVRCNKGYLVNLRHVDLLKGDTVVVDGDELLISRRKKEAFRRALMDYYGGSRV